eukprot:709896-Pyramimonas_sp.AAC.3
MRGQEVRVNDGFEILAGDPPADEMECQCAEDDVSIKRRLPPWTTQKENTLSKSTQIIASLPCAERVRRKENVSRTQRVGITVHAAMHAIDRRCSTLAAAAQHDITRRCIG